MTSKLARGSITTKKSIFRLTFYISSSDFPNRFVNGADEGNSIYGKEYLEYYLVYDKDDNILAFCDSLDELSIFVNRRKKELKYRFKTKDLVYIQVPKLLKLYKFIEV